jgi:hypothetical protein
MCMVAGSDILGILTSLPGFVIPPSFDSKLLIVKALGAILAVDEGVQRGKEGAVCPKHLLVSGIWSPGGFPSTAGTAGRSKRFSAWHVLLVSLWHLVHRWVGVLFSVMRVRRQLHPGPPKHHRFDLLVAIMTYLFPCLRRSAHIPLVTFRGKTFLCSLVVVATLKQPNPTGTGPDSAQEHNGHDHSSH